jgi:hypothetical protein
MVRAAVIWRVPALMMSDVSCPGPAELRRIGQLGPLWAQISARDRGIRLWNWAGWYGCRARIGPCPSCTPPALPTGLRASPQLAITRPPLQTTVYKHFVEL